MSTTSTIASQAMLRMQPSATIAFTERARALKQSGRDVVFLTVGEPDLDTPQNIRNAAIEAIHRGETRYPPTAGIAPLRAAIVEKFRRDNNMDVTTRETIVAPGGKNIIFNAFAATLDAGDEVIIPAPYWVSYPDLVAFPGGVPVIVQTRREDGYKLTPAQLEASITPRTKWLVLNSPSNPTGSAYTADELRALAEVLDDHPHVWAMSDDLYEHMLYDDFRFATLAEVAPSLASRTLTVNGVSKAYAMTGWRVGYAAGPTDLIAQIEKLTGQQTTGTCTIAQWAALEALTGPQDFLTTSRALFAERRDLVLDLLGRTDRLECDRPEGAFYVFPSCARTVGLTTPKGRAIGNDLAFAEALLEEADVAIVPGSSFGSEGAFRLSYAASTETLVTACNRIVEFCESLR
ncbi:aspartate aminotransferase [Novosphingobium chloroacetimidivorans]|uniref:Aminotransferase n=1 Tax=Novosphingobium chloroacetimidivorans TaxID=1428314 RepID=A0A7W7K826_9SPHN|nr:pyridoxal phosphate-dependent aminotransferase [Novosphingobium chloroacetimidivorans]MBB4857967.1 aspartate aminotransferase [Novosphingobium chloroacetimidivorans]